MLVQRSAPPVLPTYGSYKQYLRFDFYYACAYCSTSEVEAGAIGFEIDHYKPRVEGGSDDYENLMWSCEHCNGGASKGDWWPTADQQAQGIRLLRPDFDNLAEHYDLDGTELKSKSVTAETSITMLRLNRETLRRLRSFRDRLYRAKGATMLGLQALQQISLDHLKPELALKLIEIRREMQINEAELKEALDACTIRAFNHSPMLDPDPNKKHHATARKAYLESIKAILPPPPTIASS